MRTLTKLSYILIILSVYNIRIQACTSFAVYSSEIWYGMNFDYQEGDIKFSINRVGNRNVFKAQLGTGVYIAGMNDSGLFTNYQLLYYNNESPVFNPSSNMLSIGDLNNYSINQLSTVDQIIDYIGTKQILPSWGLDLHSLFADTTSNAIVVEPFGSINGITYANDSFIVMTNLPNYDFIGMDYNEVYGEGSDRYQLAHVYINEHLNDFTHNNGLEILEQTVQNLGDYPTQVSLLFDPINMEIYFCMHRDFSKVWKVSLINETIETHAGYTNYGIADINENGIWSYDLSSIENSINIEEPDLSDAILSKIYFDRSSRQLKIALNSNLPVNSSYDIYNIEGKLILSGDIINITDVTIDMQNNSSGLYFVKLFINGKTISRKVYLQ